MIPNFINKRDFGSRWPWSGRDDALTGDLASVDVATKENLDGLLKVGEALLDNPVSRVNTDTGMVESVPNGGTNREALKRYNLIAYIITLATHDKNSKFNMVHLL
ncbi:putative galactolipase [Helianthus annuus]|nr:putative galactolipase [Helianthus annuus]